MYQPEISPTSLSPNDDVLEVPLFLPSSLPPDLRARCSPKLVVMETDVRYSQCHDALASLRLHLHSRSRLLKDKYINVRHQGPNTKSQALLKSVSTHIATAAGRYNIAFSALNALDPDPKAQWRTELQVLHQTEIRGISESSLPDHPDPQRAKEIFARSLLSGGAPPEGDKVQSWIWRGAPTNPDAVSGYNEGLTLLLLSKGLVAHLLSPAYQLEWSKLYARSKRWEEEVELLKEEMRRTLVFLKWKSSQWSTKASLMPHQPMSTAMREGFNAYAFRQANVYLSLHNHFRSLWGGFEALDVSTDPPAPMLTQIEEEMQGVDGGDAVLA